MKIWLLLPLLLLIGCSNGVEFNVAETSQNFAQDVKYNRTLDILFVIDNGQSMNMVQKQLHDQLPYLFDSLHDLDMDIHIATTSMTMLSSFPESGKLMGTPKYITMDTPNFVEELKKRIFIGENGSTLEEGFGAMEAVLSESYRNAEGKGFLRDDSFLNIIVLTNEDDKSAKPWNYYASMLDKLRPNHTDGTKAWTMNFFGVLSQQDNCSSSEWGFKEPGVKFMEAVTYSGGISGSLCGNDLYRSVSTIKARIIQILTDYKLDRKPKVDTIRVYVAGLEVPKNDSNGWSYLATENLIRFNGSAVPGAEQGIRVDFLPDEAN
ncbi:MAG: hypothetical protein B7Y39_02910 [Bdellovibrio sp. 28-41-41]|nr:MAG: hypothetical protein B7Y39_02910 [Bdellovibrio sp. 28-41-41]